MFVAGGQAAETDLNALPMEDASIYRRELAVLNLLITLTTGAAGLSATLDAALDAVAELLGLPLGTVFLWNPTRRVLELAVQRAPEGLSLSAPLEIAEGDLLDTLSGRAFREQTPIFVPDVAAEATLTTTLAHHLGLRAAAVVPLTTKDEPLGVLLVASLGERAFPPPDRHLLQTIARQVAIAIERTRLYEDAARRADQMRLLVEIGQRLNSALDLAVLLRTLVAEVQGSLHCPLVCLCLMVNDILQPGAAAGRDGLIEMSDDCRCPSGGGLCSWVARHNRSLRVPDTSADRRYRRPAHLREVALRSAAIVPIRLGERLLGVLSVESDKTAAFDDLDVTFLEMVANQAAVAISNACIYAQAQQRAVQLRALLDTSRELNSTLDLGRLLEAIGRQARSLIDVDTCIISLLNPAAQTLTPVVAQGPGAEEALGISLKLGQGITGHVAATGIAEIVNHSEQDPRAMLVPGTPAEPEALLAAPLLHQGRVIGVMTLGRYGERPFQPADLELLNSFASQAATAVENARLYTESNQRAHELQRAHDRLEKAQNQLLQAEKLSAVGHLAAGIAHELNNPLTAIIGFAQLLADSNLDQATRADVERILGAAARAQKIVANLLTYSHQQRIEPEWVDLGALVERILKFHAPEFEAGGTVTCVDLAPNLPEARVDPAQMEQLLLHLLRNAHRAVAQAGRERVTVRLRQPNATTLRLEVADEGPGIPADLASRMFEPFSTDADVGEGQGLGLAACFGIVRAHGGRIWSEPRSSGGTRFIIELPLDGESHHALDDQERVALVVTRDETLGEALRRAVEEMGHHASLVESAEAALAEIVIRSYDLVLCDVNLPGMGIARLYESALTNDAALAYRFIAIGQPPANLAHLPTVTLPLHPAQIQQVIAHCLNS